MKCMNCREDFRAATGVENTCPHCGGSCPAPCSLLIDGNRYFIREVVTHTETRFEGYYKGNSVTVWLDDDDYEPEDCRYYIMVTNEEAFGTSYDGWAPEEIDNLEDAIKEALRGSCLLRENASVSHRAQQTKGTD